MKYLITIIFLSISFSLSSQSVLGIERFALKTDVLNMMKDRYGILKIHDGGDKINIDDPSIGHLFFKFGSLYFSFINGANRFNGASFESYYSLNNVKDAKEFRDALMSTIQSKYGDDGYEEFVNKDGFKCCYFGKDPRTDLFLGEVSLVKGKGKDGIQRLYVLLDYYPFIDTSLNDF